MTLTSFQAITPLVADTFQALQITATDQSQAIAQAIEASIAGDYIRNGSVECVKLNGSAAWRVHVLPLVGDEQIGNQGDWLVVTNDATLSIYTNDAYTSKFNPPGQD